MAPPILPGSAQAGTTRSPDTKSKCCVIRCRKYQREGRREFFSLPEGDRRVFWLKSLGRRDLLHASDICSYKICPKHFKKVSIKEKRFRGTMGAAPRVIPQTPGAITRVDAVTQTDATDGRDQPTVKIDVPWYGPYSPEMDENFRLVTENKENQKF